VPVADDVLARGTPFAAAHGETINPANLGEHIMARGSKEKYTDKQKRQAEHIEEGYKDRGVSEDEAERRAWATVNKSSGGGKKSGSGRGKKTNKSPMKKGGRKGGKKSSKKKQGSRKKGGGRKKGGRKKKS
jgi:plasmid stabilization system protein ParE